MSRGPLGGELVTIGPFSYDPDSPPQCPPEFKPPDDIINPKGDLRWYTNWEGEPIEHYGFTGMYDRNEDRMICENRMMGYEGGEVSYTHDDMIHDLLTETPIPEIPEEVIASEAGGIRIGDEITISAEIPTAAGGAWVSTERLDKDITIIERGSGAMTIEELYKHIYTLALLDMPESTVVRVNHKLGFFENDLISADRTFNLGEAYRELQFVDEMPDPLVSPGGSQ